MQAFTTLTGLVVPLDRANVDTDAILPKQFMKSISRTGFGPNLFDALRYMDHGEPGIPEEKRVINPNFPLNFPRYAGASVLLTRQNFGCGSSREHAPWALHDYGIRALIAPSFADIFRGNCFKNGLLPIELENKRIDTLFERAAQTNGFTLHIDLAAQTLTDNDSIRWEFDIEPSRKQVLLRGLDDIDLTLLHYAAITDYENKRRPLEPWLFPA